MQPRRYVTVRGGDTSSSGYSNISLAVDLYLGILQQTNITLPWIAAILAVTDFDPPRFYTFLIVVATADIRTARLAQGDGSIQKLAISPFGPCKTPIPLAQAPRLCFKSHTMRAGYLLSSRQ